MYTHWKHGALTGETFSLGFVDSSQLVVDAVLEIMQKAVVPWSNVVEALVQQHLEMKGPKYVRSSLTEVTEWNPVVLQPHHFPLLHVPPDKSSSRRATN